MTRLDPYVAAGLEGGRLTLRTEAGTTVPLTLTAPADGVLRIRAGEPRPDTPMLVDAPDHAVELTVTAEGVLARAPGVDALWASDGQGLRVGRFRRPARTGSLDAAHAGAGRLVTSSGQVGWVDSAALDPDVRVVGGGESFQGPDLTGRVRTLVNVETHGTAGVDRGYLSAPLFVTDAGWGLFWCTAAPLTADIGATDTGVASFTADDLDLFIIAGDPAHVLRRYLALTGRPRVLPAWAHGVWMSRCTYVSERQIGDVLDELDAAGCPVDVVHVDGWVTGNVIEDLTCNWTVDRDRFPAGWTGRLADRGVRTSLWVNPYTLSGSDRELADLLVRRADGTLATTADKPDRHLVDFTNPEAARWWRARVAELVDEGAAAIKTDFAEELPYDAVLADGRSGRAARNEYGLTYQDQTARAMAAAGAGPVLFARAGTAGAQRNPCHWVGDSPSTWPGLVSALRGCLSLSLSGFSYVGHDIGGFWTPGSGERAAEALRAALTPGMANDAEVVADVEPELYARWAQWGAFSPVMRFHGTGRREPTAYPEPARSVAIEACRLRRRLLPYLQRVAHDSVAVGLPMMRPPLLTDTGCPAARGADLQYLLGPDLLVAPILRPGGERTFWLPPGDWRSVYSGMAPRRGPEWTAVRCRLDQFPAYVRAGSPLEEELA